MYIYNANTGEMAVFRKNGNNQWIDYPGDVNQRFNARRDFLWCLLVIVGDWVFLSFLPSLNTPHPASSPASWQRKCFQGDLLCPLLTFLKPHSQGQLRWTRHEPYPFSCPRPKPPHPWPQDRSCDISHQGRRTGVLAIFLPNCQSEGVKLKL